MCACLCLITECPEQFPRIGNLTGCYHAVSQKVSWDEAEAACQALDPQAHLVSFETRTYVYSWAKIVLIAAVSWLLIFYRKRTQVQGKVMVSDVSLLLFTGGSGEGYILFRSCLGWYCPGPLQRKGRSPRSGLGWGGGQARRFGILTRWPWSKLPRNVFCLVEGCIWTTLSLKVWSAFFYRYPFQELETVSEHVNMELDGFLTFWTGGKDHEENNQLTWTGQ